MPAKLMMTWEPKPRRWRKMHKGKVYAISCRELGKPETKEGSYQAANEWWTKKLAEIEHGPPSKPSPRHITIEMIKKRLRWAEQNNQPEIVDEYRERLKVVEEIAANVPMTQAEHDKWRDALDEQYPFPNNMDERLQDARELGMDLGKITVPSLLDNVVGDGRVWHDRFKRSKPKEVPEDKTVKVQVDKYLTLERTRVQGKAVSVGEYELVTRALYDFREWIGAGINIESIDADRLEAWWSHLVVADLSVDTKKRKMRHVRAFIAWLAEKGQIRQLTNLNSRRHRFGGNIKAVPTIPISKVKELVESASGQLRLHLLLMINCGMTQIDITDLKPSEVDWKKGRIRRKRSKTSDHENVPMVEYVLWPSTFELLKEYGKRDGDRALLTASGLPWVRDVLKADGKRSKVDNIKSNFAHVKKRKGLDFSMKVLRKTSASLLESNQEFARYATLFLGHSPRSIADRHYLAPSQENFDRAVMWLGERYEILI